MEKIIAVKIYCQCGVSIIYWWIKIMKTMTTFTFWNAKRRKGRPRLLRLGYEDNILLRLKGALLAWQPSQTRASRARGVVFSLRLPAWRTQPPQCWAQDAIAVFWHFPGPVPTQRGHTLTQQPHLYSRLTHTHTVLACSARHQLTAALQRERC